MKKIYAVVKHPGSTPSVQYIHDDPKTLQGFVEGYIKELQLTGAFTLLCNENGRRRGLRDNIVLPVGPISGPVLVVAHTPRGALRSLTAHEQREAILSLERIAL